MVWFDLFQRPVLKHCPRPADNLLGRLKDEDDFAREVVLALRKNFGDAEQYGGVPIVTAGVHLAVYT